jgi:hypothetical protein
MYDMIRLSADIVQMRGASHSGVAMMRMDVNRLPAKTGKAVFSVYGNQYFLHEMWTKESTDHVTFTVSRAERKLKVASNSIHQPDIQLALLDVPR